MKMRTVVEEEEAAAAAAVIVRWRSPYERVERMASGNAVVVFSVSGCCMCHVVKRLLLGLGVWPTVYELDQLEEEGGGSSSGGSSSGGEIHAALAQLLAAPGALHMLPSASAASSTARTPTAGVAAVPAVFVGGKLLGGVESLMACHINGALVPLLKKAGALWL